MEILRFNSSEVWLASTDVEINATQALRYRIFYEEMGAEPTTKCRVLKRDIYTYDNVYDHLLVIDTEKATLKTHVWLEHIGCWEVT